MADKDDKLDSENFDDFDFSEFETTDESEAVKPKNNREAVTASLKEGAKGFMDDFKEDKISSGLDIMEAAIPKSLSKETDIVKNIHSNMQEDLEKATKEVRVNAKRTLRTVEKILPKNQTVDKLLSKVHNFLGDDEESGDNGPSKEEIETTKIDGLLKDSLGEKTDRETMEQLITDQIQANRFKTNIELLSSIAANTERSRKFNNEVASAYFRKSLELQYRSLYTAKEQLKVLAEGMDTFKYQFESIIKNTSLPDVVKLRKGEAFKAMMHHKVIDDVQDKLFKNNSLVSTVRENTGSIINNVNDKVLSGLGASDMIADQAGMMGDIEAPGMSKGTMAGSLLAGAAKTKLGQFLSNKFTKTKHGKDAIYNIKNNMVDISASAKDNADKLRNKGGFLNKSAAKILDFTGDITNTKNRDINSITIDKDDLTNPAIFDGKAYSSVTKIIPGLLSKIYGEIKGMRTGTAPEDHEITYNHDQDKFTNKSDLSKDLKSSIQSKISKNSVYSIDSFIKILQDEGSLKKINEKETRELRKGIVKYILTGKPHTPSKLIKNGFTTMFPKNLGRKVKIALSNVLKEAKNEPGLITEIDDVFKYIRQSIPNIQTKINEFKKNGDIDSFVKSGLVDYDKIRGEHKFNSKKYEKLILEATGNIKTTDIQSIKDEIQKKKAGEETKDESSILQKVKGALGVTKEPVKQASDIIKEGTDRLKQSKVGTFVNNKINDLKQSDTYNTIQQSDTVKSIKENVAGLETGVTNFRINHHLTNDDLKKKVTTTKNTINAEIKKAKEDGLTKTARRYKDNSVDYIKQEHENILATELGKKAETFVRKGVSVDSPEYRTFITHLKNRKYIQAGKIIPKLAAMAKEQIPDNYINDLVTNAKETVKDTYKTTKATVSTSINEKINVFKNKVKLFIHEVRSADQDFYNQNRIMFDNIITAADNGEMGKALKQYSILVAKYTKYMHKRYGAKYVENSKLGQAVQNDISKVKTAYTGGIDITKTAKETYAHAKETVTSLQNEVKKKIDLKILDLNREQINEMKDEFLTSDAYAMGKVKTFEEYVASMGFKIKDFNYTQYLDRSIIRKKKDELINTATNAIKDRLNPTLKTITPEEETVLQEEFFESDAYRKGYVKSFKDWLRAKGLLPNLHLKAKIQAFLKKTRALDRKIMKAVPGTIWKGMKLAGTGIKYGAKGAVVGGKLAAVAPLITAGSVLRQVTGIDLLEKSRLGKKVNKGVDTIRGGVKTTKDTTKTVLSGILQFMKNFRTQKKKEEKETLKEKLAKAKKKINPFDRDGDGKRDGNWRDRLKHMFSNKSDKKGTGNKARGILAKMKDHKGLSTTAILLGILAASKAMGITLDDVKNFAQGFIGGIKTIGHGISYVSKILKDTYYHIKNLAGNIGITIMSGISKIPGLGSLAPSAKDLAINKAKNNGTYNLLYNKNGTPKVDKNGTPLDPNATVREDRGINTGKVAAYGIAGAAAYKLGGKHIVKGVTKLGYKTVKHLVTKGGKKATEEAVKEAAKATAERATKAAAEKTIKKAGIKAAKIAAEKSIKRKIKASAIKMMLHKVRNTLIKKVGMKGASILLGKIAARFVPFAGWAMLAYDAVKIGYDMIANGTPFKSAVSKQVLGFDIFDDETPVVNPDGKLVKPDIQTSAIKVVEHKNTINMPKKQKAVADTIATIKHKQTYIEPANNVKIPEHSGDYNTDHVAGPQHVTLAKLITSNNPTYAPPQPITTKGILSEIKGNHGFNKGKLLTNIVNDEGLRTHKYKDSLGFDTIGVGHLLEPGKSTPLKDIIGRNTNVITKPEAYKILAHDVNKTTTSLYNKLPWLNKQPENIQNDINNMAFNLGVNGLLKFKDTLKYLKADEYAKSAQEMADSKWYKQTGNRAKRITANVFNTARGDISPDKTPVVGVSKHAINNFVKNQNELNIPSTDTSIKPSSGNSGLDTNTNKKADTKVAILPNDIIQSAKQQHVTDGLLKPMKDKIALQKTANESLDNIHGGIMQSVDLQKQMLDTLTIIANQNDALVKHANNANKEKTTHGNVGKNLDQLKEDFPDAAISLKRASF